MYLDQSKYFDRIDHAYPALVLEVPGLGPNFRRCIIVMHSNMKSFNQMNGFFSKSFRIEHSVS